jgi:L-asparaginase
MKPKILVLALGGTIASKNFTPIGEHYSSPVASISALIKEVPYIDEVAIVESVELFIKKSQNITLKDCFSISDYINGNFSFYDGIVITMGTNSLEDVAFFLHLTTKATIPIIVTGAMKANGAIDFDGSRNLYNAIMIATNKDLFNQGVMVTINDKIFSARDVQKKNSLNKDAFESRSGCIVGHVIGDKIHINARSNRPHTRDSIFVNIDSEVNIPKIAVIYHHLNFSAELISYFLTSKYSGIVIAGSGNGYCSDDVFKELEATRKTGIIVVRASQASEGCVTLDEKLDLANDFIPAMDFSPGKASILLALCILKKISIVGIRRIFTEY